jgi:hypothetical protein
MQGGGGLRAASGLIPPSTQIIPQFGKIGIVVKF